MFKKYYLNKLSRYINNIAKHKFILRNKLWTQ